MLKVHVPMRRDTCNILIGLYRANRGYLQGIGNGVLAALMSCKVGTDIDGQPAVNVTNLVGRRDFEGLDLLFQFALGIPLRDALIEMNVDPASDFEGWRRGIAADYKAFTQLLASPPKKQSWFGAPR